MCELNNPARRQVVKDLVFDHRGTLVCLQETKLQEMDSLTVASTLGPDFA
jgi:exonuclease III